MATKLGACAEGMCLTLPSRCGHSIFFFFHSFSEEGLSTFEELFLYACPKFICANSPPYDDPAALASMLIPPTPTSPSPQNPSVVLGDPTQRHLRAASSHFMSLTPVSSLKSLLKLYTSLDAQKLTGFLDTSGAGVDEEEVLSWMMVMKNAGRCVGRVNTSGSTAANGEKDNDEGSRPSESLLGGEWMSISDLNFVIDQVRYFLHPIHFEELTQSFRTWSTSLSQRLAGDTQGGLSVTRSMQHVCLTASKHHHCHHVQSLLRFRKRVLMCQREKVHRGRLDRRLHGVGSKLHNRLYVALLCTCCEFKDYLQCRRTTRTCTTRVLTCYGRKGK